MWACPRLFTTTRHAVHWSKCTRVTFCATHRRAPPVPEMRVSSRRQFQSSVMRMTNSIRETDTVASLLERGAELVIEEDWKHAHEVLEKAYQNDDKSDAIVSAYISMNLGFVYHQLKDLDNARIHYQLYIDAYEKHQWRDRLQTHDYASTLVNYAELLATEEATIKEATVVVRKSIRHLRFLENNLFLAAALSNLSTYLCQQGKYEEAKRPCTEALNIFIREMGRHSDHTRTTFSTMYQILTVLGKEEELADLEADWETIDPKDIGKPVKGIHTEDADIFEKEIEDKHIMKKLELPDVGKAIDDLEKPIEHQATKTDKNKEGEEDKEDNRLYLDHVNNIDEFFGTKKAKEGIFDIADETTEKVTEEETLNNVKEAERFVHRFQLKGTNEWKLFRVTDTTPKETETTRTPTQTQIQQTEPFTKKPRKQKPTAPQPEPDLQQFLQPKQRRQSRENVKEDVLPQEAEWKRREEQIKALGGFGKKKKRTHETEF